MVTWKTGSADAGTGTALRAYLPMPEEIPACRNFLNREQTMTLKSETKLIIFLFIYLCIIFRRTLDTLCLAMKHEEQEQKQPSTDRRLALTTPSATKGSQLTIQACSDIHHSLDDTLQTKLTHVKRIRSRSRYTFIFISISTELYLCSQ